jgi:hypothetical protein
VDERDETPTIGVRTWLKWTGLALLGICIAAAVSVAAGSLSSQPIGLTSEPVSAGDKLVPKAVFAPSAPHRRPAGPGAQTTPAGPGSAPTARPAPGPSTEAPADESEDEADADD